MGKENEGWDWPHASASVGCGNSKKENGILLRRVEFDEDSMRRVTAVAPRAAEVCVDACDGPGVPAQTNLGGLDDLGDNFEGSAPEAGGRWDGLCLFSFPWGGWPAKQAYKVLVAGWLAGRWVGRLKTNVGVVCYLRKSGFVLGSACGYAVCSRLACGIHLGDGAADGGPISFEDLSPCDSALGRERGHTQDAFESLEDQYLFKGGKPLALDIIPIM
ncbi:hypothetical protein BJ166DRAFT_496098 [Pestalotiopsis sp. NC0098]|nr:hypothetical protein BJ166DRAFT_496098 [Pestalotiopsis sp. NC0098]